MAAFFVTVMLLSMLILGGVIVNLYLYTRGAMGVARGRRLQPVAIASLAQEAALEEQYDMQFFTAVDETSAYARASLRVLLTIVFMIVIILIALVSAVLH